MNHRFSFNFFCRNWIFYLEMFFKLRKQQQKKNHMLPNLWAVGCIWNNLKSWRFNCSYCNTAAIRLSWWSESWVKFGLTYLILLFRLFSVYIYRIELIFDFLFMGLISNCQKPPTSILIVNNDLFDFKTFNP